MTIEIITRVPCPTCGGTGTVETHPVNISWLAKTEDCDTCHGDGTVPRVLATFADAAVLATAIGIATGEPEFLARMLPGVHIVPRGYVDLAKTRIAVLAALGVTNES